MEPVFKVLSSLEKVGAALLNFYKIRILIKCTSQEKEKCWTIVLMSRKPAEKQMIFGSPGNCTTDLSTLPLYLKGPWVTTVGSHILRPSYEVIRMARRYIPHQMADLLHLHTAGQLTFFSQRPLLIPFHNTLEQRNTLSTFWEVSLGYLELSLAEPSTAALTNKSIPFKWRQ